MGGDSGNTFPRVPALEKVRAVPYEEFGHTMACVAEVFQSLCGMATASRSFSLSLGDFIRTLGCVPSRPGPGAWMKKDEVHEGCSCAPTHVDDLLIIGTNPEITMRKFEETFLIRTQEIDPEVCLGLKWEVDEKGKRKAHNETFTKEAIRQLKN